MSLVMDEPQKKRRATTTSPEERALAESLQVPAKCLARPHQAHCLHHRGEVRVGSKRPGTWINDPAVHLTPKNRQARPQFISPCVKIPSWGDLGKAQVWVMVHDSPHANNTILSKFEGTRIAWMSSPRLGEYQMLFWDSEIKTFVACATPGLQTGERADRETRTRTPVGKREIATILDETKSYRHDHRHITSDLSPSPRAGMDIGPGLERIYCLGKGNGNMCGGTGARARDSAWR